MAVHPGLRKRGSLLMPHACVTRASLTHRHALFDHRSAGYSDDAMLFGKLQTFSLMFLEAGTTLWIL